MNNKQKTLYYTLIIIVLIITDITLFTKNQSLSEEIIKDQIITEQAQLLQLTDDLKLKVISPLGIPIYKHYYAI